MDERMQRIAGPRSVPWLIAAGAAVAVLAVAIALAPRRTERIQQRAASRALAPDARVVEVLARLSPARSLADIRGLSGVDQMCARGECGQIVNRLTGDPGLALSLDYIVEQVGSLGYSVTIEPWTNGRLSDRNVILRKTGVVSPTEEVYVVAHVDGVGTCPGPQCPGADDNASGTVAALELARALAPTDFARSVVVFFSTGEEQGTVGVDQYIAKMSPSDIEAVHALINADMVGYDGNGDNVIQLYYGDHQPSLALAREIDRTIATYAPVLRPEIDPGCG